MKISDIKFAAYVKWINELEDRLARLDIGANALAAKEFRSISRDLDKLGAILSRWETSNDPKTAEVVLRYAACAARAHWIAGNFGVAAQIHNDIAQRCVEIEDSLTDDGEVPRAKALMFLRYTRMIALSDGTQTCVDLGDLEEAERRCAQAYELLVEQMAGEGVEASVGFTVSHACLFLGFARGRVPDVAMAEQAFEFASHIGGPRLVMATANLALVYANSGDNDRALELYQQVVDHPDNTVEGTLQARLAIGTITAHTDAALAHPILVQVAQDAQAANLPPVFAQACVMVGSVYIVGGEREHAREWFQAGLNTSPDPRTRATLEAFLGTSWQDVDEQRQAAHFAQARECVADQPAGVRAPIDFGTLVQTTELTAQQHADLMAATLVLDTWRLVLPMGTMRESWQRMTIGEGVARLLAATHRRQDPGLFAAVCAHLCAISAAPTTGGPDQPPALDDPAAHRAWLPPQVLVAGADPLAEAIALAGERYGLDIRDDSRTVRALEPGPGEVELIAVQQVDGWACWRSDGAVHTHTTAGAALTATLAELAAATAFAGSATGRSALTVPEAEESLMRHLGELLLPPALVAELVRLGEGGTRPRLRIRADGPLAQVPWAALIVAEQGTTRLIDLADVVTLAPFGLRTQPAIGDEMAGSVPATGGVLAIIDPRVPGAAPDSRLGPVLSLPGAALWRDHLRDIADSAGLCGAAGGGGGGGGGGAAMVARRDQDRVWLGDALAQRPTRLLFVGHTSLAELADGGREAALHLCCGTETTGLASEVGTHRPFTAGDLMAMPHPLPPRVGLVGCASGADARVRDGIGLAHAALTKGASLVTGLRWPVPTEQWFADTELGPDPGLVHGPQLVDDPELVTDVPASDPLAALALAVDGALASDDPIAALGDWQRAAAQRWQAGGQLRDSPLIWASVHSIIATT